jgi:hypothetical protein
MSFFWEFGGRKIARAAPALLNLGENDGSRERSFFLGAARKFFWGDFGSRGLEKSVAKDFFWGDFGSRGPVFLGKLGAADQF